MHADKAGKKALKAVATGSDAASSEDAFVQQLLGTVETLGGARVRLQICCLTRSQQLTEAVAALSPTTGAQQLTELLRELVRGGHRRFCVGRFQHQCRPGLHADGSSSIMAGSRQGHQTCADAASWT